MGDSRRLILPLFYLYTPSLSFPCLFKLLKNLEKPRKTYINPPALLWFICSSSKDMKLQKLRSVINPKSSIGLGILLSWLIPTLKTWKSTIKNRPVKGGLSGFWYSITFPDTKLHHYEDHLRQRTEASSPTHHKVRDLIQIDLANPFWSHQFWPMTMDVVPWYSRHSKYLEKKMIHPLSFSDKPNKLHLKIS